MIVFSAFLVVVAVGLLVAGVVTSKLLLVYMAIGVSGVSLLALGLGAILKRHELFGKTQEAEPARPQPAAAQAPSVHDDVGALPQPAAAPAGYGWSAAAQPGPPPRAGYLPSEPPSRIRPPAAQPPPAWGSSVPPAASFPPAPGFPGAQPVAPAAGPPVGDRPQPPPPGRPADLERPPAAFTPRPAPGTSAAAPAPFVPTVPSAPVVHTVPAEPLASVTPPPAEDQQVTETRPAAESEPAPQEPLPTGHLPSAPDERPASEEPVGQDLPEAKDDQQAESLLPGPAEPPVANDQATEEQVTEEQVTEEQVTEDEATGQPEPEPVQPAQDELPTSGEQQPPDSAPPADGGAELPAVEVDLLRQVTVVPGVPRYHNAQCILIRFMGEEDLNRMTLAEARQVGCTPCRACQPDQP